VAPLTFTSMPRFLKSAAYLGVMTISPVTGFRALEEGDTAADQAPGVETAAVDGDSEIGRFERDALDELSLYVFNLEGFRKLGKDDGRAVVWLRVRG
jgi:hypothetical protein